MERRMSRHTKRIRERIATIPDMEQEILTANLDGKTLEKVITKLEYKISLLENELEDAKATNEDLTSELEELRGFYLVQHPTSLTALMELEERLS